MSGSSLVCCSKHSSSFSSSVGHSSRSLYEFVCLVFFFFQAEDGIRDIGVTGVQTCALPISRRSSITSLWIKTMASTRSCHMECQTYFHKSPCYPHRCCLMRTGRGSTNNTRSEERRVGKECRSRRSTYH